MVVEALKALTKYKQFIIHRDKLPINYRTATVANAHDPDMWTDYETAVKTAKLYGNNYGIGFVFTENDPFFFIDIDHCLNPDGKTWSQTALDVMQYVPGAAIEVSRSGTGLHIIGQAAPRPHKCKNIACGLELYTKRRYVALTETNTQGLASTDCNMYMDALIQQYFPATTETTSGEWTVEPVPEWNGPEDDRELIEKACSTQSGAGTFGARCTFRQLWVADTVALSNSYPDTSGSREYDGSSADAALAQHLAFWAGNNCERIRSLMQQSALIREKWDREDYLIRTISKAVALQKNVYTAGANNTFAEKYGAPAIKASSEAQRKFAENIRNKRLSEATEEQAKRLITAVKASFWLDNQDKSVTDLLISLTPVENVIPPMSSTLKEPTITAGYQYLNADLQIEYFKNCVYIQDLHRVFTPDGSLLKSEQFNATYGGYMFQMDDTGRKTTKKAWEALTESQLIRYPKAQGICFKPQLPTGTFVTEEGRILLNSYVPVEIPKIAGDPAPFVSHLKKVLPDEHDQNILLAYMAACIQYKGVKFQWAPLLQGTEGNGKTLFTRCVSYAIGKRYTHYPKASDIDNKFNGWLLNKLFIGVEDVYVPDNRREIIETLKPMITGVDGIEIQYKGADQITADICANFMLNSNHRDAIRKTRNDRRFAVFFTAQQSSRDIESSSMAGDYFPKLYKWLNANGYAIINDYLSSYSIPDELNPATSCHRAPETSTTDEAIHMGLGSIEQEIIEAIDENRPGFAGGWVSSIAIDRLLHMLHAARFIPQNKRRELMQNLGYDWHPGLHKGRVDNPIMMDDGKKPRLFIKQGHIAINLFKSSDISKTYQEAQGAVVTPVIFKQKES